MKNNEIKYFAYCRKSSEDSQRQVASIRDQINALRQITEREELCLVREPFTEEKSAKDPGRPVFNDMLNKIGKEEANALLCWDIDRLSRNPIDNGKLQWMLQKGVIKVIKTPSRSYYPEDAGLLMSIEGGRATDYVMRLSKNVKRGLDSKAMRGWRPNGSPIGYLNTGTEKGNRIITSDPERFDLIRKMWDLFLTGTYPISKILDIVNNEWGLRTLQRRRLGGKLLSQSHLYKIFNDTFYYGYFLWNDPETGEKKLYKGNHEPMITEAEYWRVQTLLGKKGKQRFRTRDFPFTGLMKCGECGSGITAEEKHQLICTVCKNKFAYENKNCCPKCKTDIGEMKNPKILFYTYYHCNKKKKSCSQKTIRTEELENQFNEKLSEITIDKEYLEIALDYLHDKQKNSGKEEKAIRQSVQSTYDSCQTRLNNLHKEYTSVQNSNHELYTPEEFKKLKSEMITERDNLEKQQNESKEKLDQSLEITERIFNFCTFAKHHFNNTDDIKKKRAIFSTIGSNLILKDKKLIIDKLHPYLLIENEIEEKKKLYSRLEPKKRLALKGQNTNFLVSVPHLLGD